MYGILLLIYTWEVMTKNRPFFIMQEGAHRHFLTCTYHKMGLSGLVQTWGSVEGRFPTGTNDAMVHLCSHGFLLKLPFSPKYRPQ